MKEERDIGFNNQIENGSNGSNGSNGKDKKIENDVILDGSEYNVQFSSCKFQSFKPKDYVNCKFINCSFPNTPEIGISILEDINNEYKNCDINIDGVIKKLFNITNGVSSLVSSINVFLNKNNNSDHSTQVVDVGKIKNTKSFLAVI